MKKGQRGPEYEALKEKIAQKLFAKLYELHPEVRRAFGCGCEEFVTGSMTI